MKKEIGLYVHIPFCESKCFYCNFVSKKANNEEKRKYVDFLLQEIEINKNQDFLIKSIFIGGGTPSCLGKGQILLILSKIRECFCLKSDVEITIEANPNSFSKQKAEEYKKSGINRISFGLQTANNRLLKKINRIHTKKDFLNAVKFAKNVGITNINADILIGLPSQNKFHVKNTLKLLKKCDCKHISCYTLILEENTQLFEMVKTKKCKLPSEEKNLKMFEYCNKILSKNGFKRYEVSNFAKNGFECEHNLIYWNCDDYLGLGLNSHSKIENERFENFADFENYYNALKNNKKPIKNRQKLTKNIQKEEFVMLNLRKIDGIDLKKYQQFFGEKLDEIKQKEIEILAKFGFIKLENNQLFATNKGFEVLNQIILQLV